MPDGFLQRVYDLQTQSETDAYYTEWAKTYDRELAENGYRSPERCAQALARYVQADARILDVGCGTGLSGRALANAGFTNISGRDVNAAMLEVAHASGSYREVTVSDPADPFPFKPGTYAAVAAIGVIGIGAAPASLLGEAVDALEAGGHLVFSYNDHALADPVFVAALDEALSSGRVEQVFSEHGPHIEALGTTSTVFVLQRR